MASKLLLYNTGSSLPSPQGVARTQEKFAKVVPLHVCVRVFVCLCECVFVCLYVCIHLWLVCVCLCLW